MQIDPKVQELLDKINAGKLDIQAHDLDDTEFGLYIPTYVDGNVVRLMEDGFSQTETNLEITINKHGDPKDHDAKIVGWLASATGKDSSCSHGGSSSCKHCTSHAGKCRHCTSHGKAMVAPDFDADPLDYDDAAKKIFDKQDVLHRLAPDEFGLALLHGHSDKHEFTKLPEDYVSVIANGKTTFRTLEDIAKDTTFVPNTWRFVNGELKPAGGFSAAD